MPEEEDARGGGHRSPAQSECPTKPHEVSPPGLDWQGPSWLPEIGFENDNGRDKPLSFHWQVERGFFEASFGSSGDSASDDARNSILTEAVLAFESGRRWVSYSRRRGFYVHRYCGTTLTYETITRAVDWALAQGLIEEEKARSGDHLRTGRQSRLRARPCLVDAFRGAELRHELRENATQ